MGPPLIMVLGGGTMQVPAIEIAKDRGWKVAVADGNREAPGAGMADIFLHIDLKDLAALTEAARDLKRKGLRGVFTAGTDFSTSVAHVAAECGLPGIPPEAAYKAKNKARMRDAFRHAGVPSPDFFLMRNEGDCAEVPRRLHFPLVVKPADNMGARGVKRIDTPEELMESYRGAAAFSISGEVVAEEYIPGPEFSLDALIRGGRVDICGFADRHIAFPPYFVEMGHTMPTELPEKEQNLVIEVFLRGIEALGITEGAAKGDIKLTPKGPVVGEIAARLSGGYMSGWTYPYASGHEVTAGAMEIALGTGPSSLHPGYPRSSAERAFISIPGKTAEIIGIRSAGQIPFVKNIFLRTAAGAETVFPRNNIEKCGNIISQASSRREAAAAAEQAVAAVTVRLEPGNPKTEAFLFRRDAGWPPPAFTLVSPRNIRAYDAMPDYRAASPAEGPVLMLPDTDSENEREWHGISFTDALCRALTLRARSAGGTGGEKGEVIVPGKIFWKGFLRGGIQGGLWVLETLEQITREGKDPAGVIKRWNEM